MEVNAFDVAIIGAGPAGSTLAALLARRGVSVALVDRDRFPRDKVCGEFLSYDALPLLERLGISAKLDEIGATRIDHCRVVGERATYEFRFPQPARGLSRYAFDALLLQHAAACGATRLDGWTATGLEPGRLRIQRGDESRDVSARAIVGAWGRWGRFDQRLGRKFVAERSHRSFGFKRHYVTGRASTAIDLYSFDGGYLGVNAIEGDRTNICGLVDAAKLAGHKGRWEAFVERIRSESPALDRLYESHQPAQEQFLSSDPVIFRARAAVERGVFMIGDAAGVIDPLTGNGMAMAIQSAFLCAPALLRLLARDSESASVESAYQRDHAALFRARIRWSRAIALLLSRPRLLDTAMRATANPRIGNLFLARTRASGQQLERLLTAAQQ